MAATTKYECQDRAGAPTIVDFDATAKVFRIASKVGGDDLAGVPCDFMKGVINSEALTKNAKCGLAFYETTAAADLRVESPDILVSVAFDEKALSFLVISRLGNSGAVAQAMTCKRLTAA